MGEDQIEIDINKPVEKEEEQIDLSQFPFIYEYNTKTSTISLFKSEIPAAVNNYFRSHTGVDEVSKPNWDPYELEWLALRNHTHRRCIELKATLIAGFGYYFRNKDHENYEKLEAFLKKPNDTFGDTFSKISMNIKRVANTYGAGGLLINKALDKIQMFSSTNMKSVFVVPEINNGKRTTKIKKYIQVSRDGQNKVIFFPYDGEPKAGRRYLYRMGYKTFSNSYYPEPEYLAVLGKINEDLFVDQNNIDFFMNRARMDIVFIFSGGKLDTKKKDSIKDFYKKEFKHFKGPGNQHKTMVLEAGKGANITVHDLSKNEDGQYSKRQQALEYAIARSHGIMPTLLLLTTGGAGFGGGGVAIGDLFLQNQIMIRPEQMDYEEDWNLILESLFGFNPQIKFRTIDTNNQKDMAIIQSMLGKLGLLGMEEVREYIAEHGIMEIKPKEKPNDIIKPQGGIKPNATADIRDPKDSLDQKQDDVTTIDEDKNKDIT